MTRILKITLVIFFSAVISFNLTLKSEYFTRLSESFLSGKTYFLTQPDPDWLDATPFRGQYYYPHGPFPVIFLMPFVFISGFFNTTFYQGYIQPPLVLAVFYLSYKIAKKLNYDNEDSLFLAFAFCFSTVFFGSALWPNFLDQTLATFLLFLLVYGYMNKTPVLLLGCLVGLLLLTRASTLGIAAFPLLSALFIKKANLPEKIKSVIFLFIPIFFALILFGVYNWVRFHDIFEFGYSNVINLIPPTRAREYGVISLYHIPGNLYYFLLATPLPIFKDGISHVLRFPFLKADHWGMSIFITSPIFLYLFFLSYKDKLSKILIITISLVTFSILLYFGVGVRQFGFRYSLDFLPLLFLLLIKNYKIKYGKLSENFKVIILLSSLVNFYFFLTAFFMY